MTLKCKTCGHHKKYHHRLEHLSGRWKGRYYNYCNGMEDSKKCKCKKFEPEDEIVDEHKQCKFCSKFSSIPI